MTLQRVVLGCGCEVQADHGRGDRLAVCPGGGERYVNGTVSALVQCEGGHRYVLTANHVDDVVYTVRAA